MYIRPTYIEKNGKEHAYWTLVRSIRTHRGPRRVTVAYVGAAAEGVREGVRQAAEHARVRRPPPPEASHIVFIVHRSSCSLTGTSRSGGCAP